MEIIKNSQESYSIKQAQYLNLCTVYASPTHNCQWASIGSAEYIRRLDDDRKRDFIITLFSPNFGFHWVKNAQLGHNYTRLFLMDIKVNVYPLVMNKLKDFIVDKTFEREYTSTNGTRLIIGLYKFQIKITEKERKDAKEKFEKEMAEKLKKKVKKDPTEVPSINEMIETNNNSNEIINDTSINF